MALQAITDGYNNNIGSVRMNGSWTGNDFNDPIRGMFQWGYGSFSNTTSEVDAGDGGSGSYSRTPTVNKDRTIKFRARVCIETCTNGASSGEFKTYADPAIFTIGLTPGTPTKTTCPVTGTVNPKTTESFGNVYMEVRVQGTSPWSDNGGAIATGLSGNSGIAVSGTLSGLSPGVTYEARFRIDRNTENSTSNYSAIGTFATQADPAVIIEPPIMTMEIEALVPTLSIGAGAVIISPNPMEMDIEMLVPNLVFSQEVLVEKFITFNDIVERSVEVG